jgi:uncharacterized protein YegL
LSIHQFVARTPRPLPVIILADTSGSMEGEKIQALNAALRESFAELGSSVDPRGEVHVAVYAFDTTVREVLPLTPASNAVAPELHASGKTAMGAAFAVLRQLLEDPDRIPRRAYNPTLVLISDGKPTDEWREPLDSLLQSQRGGRAVRLAMGIGADADKTVLQKFIDHEQIPVMHGHEAGAIQQFFRWVTFSVQARSRSKDPNDAPIVPPDEFGPLAW